MDIKRFFISRADLRISPMAIMQRASLRGLFFIGLFYTFTLQHPLQAHTLHGVPIKDDELIQHTLVETPSATIANSLIQLKLFLPDHKNGFYRGTRFDWSGIIYSAKALGHEFFSPWKTLTDPYSHENVTGPAESFGSLPLNQLLADGSSLWLRIGVGVIRLPRDKLYNPYETYEVVDYGQWQVETQSDKIRFTHQINTEFGYRYVYHKTVRLLADKPGFKIEHQLVNRGSAPLSTEQYNHNFFRIDGGVADQHIELLLPYSARTDVDLAAAVSLKSVTSEGGEPTTRLSYLRTLKSKESLWIPIVGFDRAAPQHHFSIRHINKRLAVNVAVDQPLFKMAFWTIASTYCPENFIQVNVSPGQSFDWSSTYQFSKF